MFASILCCEMCVACVYSLTSSKPDWRCLSGQIVQVEEDHKTITSLRTEADTLRSQNQKLKSEVESHQSQRRYMHPPVSHSLVML